MSQRTLLLLLASSCATKPKGIIHAEGVCLIIAMTFHALPAESTDTWAWKAQRNLKREGRGFVSQWLWALNT
ncbi:hypothetical protein CPAR01_10732 [Colletotrichum paranaense]|uniref:Secreted protein n=4 Tax=Colletotrichum acutatum species complex TaxID=2707335 RepID=A0AAI9ZAI1_9PEZI|nr:uncharacterized protein CCOS01_01222 [Colletotrichum costaricense]XP_060347174.1 uncharacterized protein CPAR01_10732 [Colletotrichum paranaense]XP_060379994.1 uncharacterized protein CTAM01_09270 [Colletotrichum tamarilloi]KAI3543163.1 hypothetical protein CSPX01_06476 [Colletotrichum filicis]KAK1446422.1 hypothetical protein CMEL01_10665 [Colletotrichum melonis]KAK1493809.1 hypothetical protein CTAM01_09270 [Colletotrichum tamarilloi]KAK1534024.1 hypothetical protein CPAR01_10732 [Collet